MARCNLTERIEFETINLKLDDDNFETPEWDFYYKCWAGYRTVKGKDFIAAKADNSENIVTFTVRYCNKTKALLVPGANKKFRIKYKGFYYDILPPVSDFDNRHEFIDIRCSIVL